MDNLSFEIQARLDHAARQRDEALNTSVILAGKIALYQRSLKESQDEVTSYREKADAHLKSLEELKAKRKRKPAPLHLAGAVA